jgi:hypothetical protein
VTEVIVGGLIVSLMNANANWWTVRLKVKKGGTRSSETLAPLELEDKAHESAITCNLEIPFR